MITVHADIPSHFLEDCVYKMNFFVIALLFALAVSTHTKENGIIVLNDDNFQELTKEYENIFVEFYSTVCTLNRRLFIESSSFFGICEDSGRNCKGLRGEGNGRYDWKGFLCIFISNV